MSLNEGQLSLTEDTEPAAAAVVAPAPTTRDFEPTAEQLAAVAAREHDAFLEAGAGSGKTAVLVDRYCESVIDDGIEIDRLLAFTFTERAAAEMRGRVRRELTRRSRLARAAGDTHRADELLTAARATERAWVMTIHAFCRRLLATHPLAAGLDPRFRVLDAAESSRLREEAITAAIDALLATGDEEVNRSAAEFEPWRLTAMILGAYERLRSQGMADPRLPDVGDPIHSPKRGEEQRDLTPVEVDAAKRARAALERILESFHSRYEELKRDRSALDFADLELRALALLRSSPAVAAAWRGRFAHIMVDEFQDTNRVQLDLIEQLRGDETRIFMVGDEHQSIYRFRNADLDVFREERRLAHESDEREVLPLRGNFRSLPNVLAAVNWIGDTLLTDFAPLTAGRETDDGPGSIELLLTRDKSSDDRGIKWDAEEIDLDPGPSASPKQIIAEARRLAQRLRELVDTEGVSRGDIVVLLRAFTHVDAHEQALRRAGLRPFVVGGRGYWTQQQVEDLIRLLGSIANPLDDEYLLGALASFAAGVSPDALWLLRMAARSEEDHPRHIWPVLEGAYGEADEPKQVQAHWLEAVPEIDRERLRRFCAILARLRRRARITSIEELIETTMTEFGYDLGLIAREGGPGRMANVRKLMRLAREFEANEGRDLRGFLALASASTRRDEREGMAAVQAEGHDGVRVMTVHAAKGLQFPVVAVPDLGRALNAGRRDADLVIGPAVDEGAQRFGMRLAFASASSLGVWELVELNSLERDAESEEGARLVYVAASRAEDRLILSGVYKDTHTAAADEKPGDSPLQRLLPALTEAGWEGESATVTLPGPTAIVTDAPLPPAPLPIAIDSPDPERARELRLIMPAPPENDPLKTPAGPPPLLAERPSRVPIGHLSYSAVSLYESCGYRFYLERVLGAREGLVAGQAASTAGDDIGELEIADEMPDPGPPRALALGIGNSVHAALEWSASNHWQAPDRELIARILLREGLGGDAEAARRVEDLVGGWLSSALCAELGAAESMRAEVPFTLGIGGTVIRGQIDLLARGDDLPCVVDYKTDALHGRAPAELGDRYRAQREIYALAVGADRGARVAHVFLEDPQDPVIEELGPAELNAARDRVETLIDEMTGGSFPVTEEPYAALCFGCPAAARLCPRPAWKPPR